MTTLTNNGAVLTAHEATIQTASVEIQTLRVGKKQVTMGLFRQLPYRDLIDWGYLGFVGEGYPVGDVYEGAPWGHVNYWWDGHYPRDCAYTNEVGQWPSYGEKRHIVWQCEGQLWRVVLCEYLPEWLCDPASHTGKFEIAQWQAAWRKVWHEIAALPQLFIAV